MRYFRSFAVCVPDCGDQSGGVIVVGASDSVAEVDGDAPARRGEARVTWWRLSAVAPKLVEQLQLQPYERLRQAAADSARLAVRWTQLADPRLDAGLAALREGKFGDSSEHLAVQELTGELDEIAWDAQRTAEERDSSMQPYYAAFARARATASVKCALYSDPLKAALEAVYEAQAAINDRVAIRTVVDAALNS